MNICVVGAGYVGIANAFLMGISREVVLVDIDETKIINMKKGIMPINDEYVEKYKNNVKVKYTTNYKKAYEKADIIFIAANTNYDEENKKFDLSHVEAVIQAISESSEERKILVIKSTIPNGYSDDVRKRYPQFDIMFSPEFLRESYALYDNLYPDRVIVGGDVDSEKELVASLLTENMLTNKEVPIIYMSNSEAEIVKLFANTYLAMRVAFVNEVDTFCQVTGMGTKNVLDAIGYDHRIGRHYFNPSFGYGGYCLPKDSKQLVHEYLNNSVETSLMGAIVESNETRKKFIADSILKKVKEHETIGIYRIISKKGINNYRSSAIVDVINILKKSDHNIILYAPLIDANEFEGIPIIKDLADFKNQSSIIVANRLDDEIINFENVYTVDVYGEN